MTVKIEIGMEDIANAMNLYNVMEEIDPHIADTLTDNFHASRDWVDDAVIDLTNRDYAKLFHTLAERFEKEE